MDLINNISFMFNTLKNTDDNLSDFEYYLNKDKEYNIGLDDEMYNTPLFDNDWSLLIDFDDRAYEDNEPVVKYKLYLNEETTFKDLMLILKNRKTYGFFEGIEEIGYNKYELIWGS